jgi:hypothetical protein
MELNKLKESEKIKVSLLKHIFSQVKSDRIVIPEISVCNSVADMIEIDDDIHIYEIKSAKDSFQRLSSQINSYKKCANRITLVIDEKFIPKINTLENIEDLGIISIDTRYRLITIKEAKKRRIARDGLITYWSPVEIRETLRGFPQWYKYSTSEAQEKIYEILDDDKLFRLTMFRIKEKYRKESYRRKEALKNKDYALLLNSRFIDLDSLYVTPLLDVPSSVFIDFLK